MVMMAMVVMMIVIVVGMVWYDGGDCDGDGTGLMVIAKVMVMMVLR